MKRLLAVFFLISINCIVAQTTHVQDTLYCNYLGQEQGLLQLNVKRMAIDNLGFLWAGTEDGLHKFNSYNFKPYTHNPKDSTTIKDDHIRGLTFTKDTLWLATNTKGIEGFIPSQNRFFNLNYSNKSAELNTSYGAFILSDKHLLFAVKNHIIIYNRITKENFIIALPLGQKEGYVTDILKIDATKFWLGTSSLGVLIFDSKTFEIKDTSLFKTQRDLKLFSLENTIYIGSKEGLYVYKDNTIEKAPIALAVNCFYPINDNQFYLGTKSGLYHYNKNTHVVTNITLITKKNIPYDNLDINQIMSDDNGNLWFANEADGIFHYNVFNKKFNTLHLELDEYPKQNRISTFQYLKGKDSTLWIGSTFGIVKYSHIKNKFKFYIEKDRPLIYSIVRDKDSTIWAGGFTTGLLKYNPEEDTFKKIKTSKSQLPDEDVIEIIPIDSNTLWVCTWAGGIHEFNINTEQFEEVFINDQRINRARSSLLDSKENIWLGTDDGVYTTNRQGVAIKFQANDDSEQALSSHRVFNIKEDYNGNLWFGTNVGLTMLDINTGKTTRYYKQKGLPSDFIYSILVAKNNNLWVSTNYGLSELDTEKNVFTNYTISDGLQNNEFNGKAAYKDNFGNFYFGGISGINIFNPTAIIKNPHLPKIHIESVELFNQPLNKNELYNKKLEFKSDENVITFNFAAINYLNPEKCVYTYKMENFDNDWRPITKARSTTYTNLDPGTYTFKVKASNDVGKWNNIPDAVTLTIIPPWYDTLAFKFFGLMFILLCISLFYIYKTRKLKSDRLKLEGLVQNRTQEIQSKNNDLKAAYKEADQQRNNISFLMRELTHRVKNNLQIISSLLNIQASNLDNTLAINALRVAKNRITTISHIESKLVTENESIKIDDFIRDLCHSIISALSDDENLKFKIDFDLESAYIQNMNTTMIGLILNELITNTTKYAFNEYKPENELSITSEISENNLKINVSDNGKGYDLKNSVVKNSLGIELVHEMVEQLNGTIQINSTNGTENIIIIPIKPIY